MHFLRGLRLKLLLLSGIPMVSLLVVGAFSVYRSWQARTQIGVFVEQTLPETESLEQIYGLSKDLVSNTNGALMSWRTEDVKKDFIAASENNVSEMLSILYEMKNMQVSAETRQMWDNLEAPIGKLVSEQQRILAEITSASTDENQVSRVLIDYLYGEPVTAKNELMTALDKLGTTVRSHAQDNAQKTNSDISSMLSIVVTLVGLCFLASIALVVSFMISITRTMSETQSALDRSGKSLGSSSDILSKSAEELSTAASESAASLEESVASSTELASLVKSNSDLAAEASNISKRGIEEADLSSQEVSNLVETMNIINQSSKKIEEITSVIDDIAFQTNLLALNAAVEAARAGEQGRGFAVVADAVRTLAQKSATSAKEISEMIKDSSSQIHKGVNVAQKSATSIENLRKSIAQIAALNEQVANGNAEQSRGIDQISIALTQLDQVVQGNAATAESVSSSASSLNTDSEQLAEIITQLKIFVDGVDSTTKETADQPNDPQLAKNDFMFKAS